MALLEPDAALELVLAAVEPMPVRMVPIIDACGLITATPMTATADHPAFPRAMMDGWAVRLADAGQCVQPLEEIAAGDGTTRSPLTSGTAYPIMTGAPVPTGGEAVVPNEKITRATGLVRLPATIAAGENIVPIGSELRRGSVWLHPGQSVTPLVVAAAAALGVSEVPVRPRPRIAILTTGSELRSTTDPGCIRDSNGPMLRALAAELGFAATTSSVMDDPELLAHRLEELSDNDVLVLTGGVSVGAHDDVPAVLKQRGYDILLHKVAQRPGKPFLVARRGRQMAFALPGNPLAAHLCFCRYALPAMQCMMGRDPTPRSGRGRLAAPLPPNRERTWFMLAKVSGDEDGWSVMPQRVISSADVFTPLAANAYVRLEPGAPERMPDGDIPFTWIGPHAWPMI